MAKCCISGEKFVNFVFSPCIGLLVSPDVDELCLRDNLTFEELLKPFSQLSRDVTFRDSGNVVHTVRNLQLKFFDATASPIPRRLTQNWLRYFVNVCSADYTIRSKRIYDGSRSVIVPTSLPWFEAWRYLFITNLRSPFEHEFINHNLACIFVLTTGHPDPIRGFTELTQSQSNQQHHQNPRSGYPFWFIENVLKFYVLLHDGSSNISQSCVDEVFSQVKTTFGASNCHLLTIFTTSENNKLSSGGNNNSSNNNTTLSNHLVNSRINGISNQINNTFQPSNEPQSDPWLHHLLPHGYRLQLDQKLLSSNHDEDVMRLETTTLSSKNQSLSNSIGLNNDPLKTMNETGEGGEVESTRIFGRSKTSLYDTSHSQSENVASQSCTFLPPRYFQPHGQHLTQADRDRIRMFVYDFSVRALLPWVEKTMRSLNDQIAHRMRLSRSFFSATKKFFTQAVGGTAVVNNTPSSGNNAFSTSGTLSSLTTSKIYSTLSPTDVLSQSKDQFIANGPKTDLSSPTDSTTITATSVLTHQTTSHTTTQINNSSMVVYSSDSPESQMRRLADLAFLFQQYEVAYQTYNVLKRDFQNDSAWLHYAGAQEMSALAVYLQGSTSQRQYPYHLMDSAVTTYLQGHLSPELALRSTLLNFEALCSRGLYNEAAMAIVRLTSDEDDLVSGLLIEQIAHCVLSLKRPMLRKFAFRMALAAHRYSRAKQPHLAIRSYKSAMPIVMGHGWSLLEDHINFNVGRQAYLIGDLIGSSKALAETLNTSSRQSAERQLFFVKEYLTVLTKLLSTDGYSENLSEEQKTLPEFPLPIIDLHNFKVMIGKPSQQHQQQADNRIQVDSCPDLFVEARGVQFSDTEEEEEEESEGSRDEESSEHTEWRTHTDPFNDLQFQHFTSQYSNWMEATDISSSEESSLDDNDTSVENTGDLDNFSKNNPFLKDEDDCSTTHKRILSAHSMICQRLEYILLQTSLQTDFQSKKGGSSSLPFKRDKIIFTSRSKLKHVPTIPVGEHLTVQMTLINPMRIPLVFTNVCLLWTFKLMNSPSTISSSPRSSSPSLHIIDASDNSTQQNLQSHSNVHAFPLHQMSSSVNKDQLFNITNEIVYSSSHLNHQQIQLQQQQLVNQYVASQVLNEFIMLPGERKNLQLSLIAKQMGQITITGLGFEWSYLSAHQSAVADNSQYQTLQHHLANLTPQNGSIPNAYSSSTTNPMLTNSHIYNSLSVDKSFSTIDTVSQTMMVNYNSIPLSSSLPPPPPSNTDYTTSSTTSLSTIGERNSVRGKILFNKNCPDGDDNDNNKHKRFTKLPLDWSVTQPAPALRVFFSSFPNQLYEGEICSIQISLTNSGLIPLTNLRVASVWPGLFAFGSIDASIGSHDFNQSLQSVSIQPLKPWIDVPCNQSALNGKYTPTTGNESSFILMPGITISRTIWLRGPHLSYPSSHRKRDNSCSYRYPVHASSSSPLSTVSYTSSNSSSGYGSGVVAGSSVAASYAATTYTCPPPLPPPPLSTSAMLLPYAHQKTVHVVFQYESAKGLTSQLPASQQQQPFSGCRYVRHRCEMELKPSLHFEAMANCLNLTDVSNLLISVQIKNVVNSTVPMAFQILQIYCISRYWSIKPIESNSDIDTFPSIRTGEIITLHFKASFMKNHSQNVEETEKENGRKNDTTIGSVNKFLSTIHFDHHHHHQQQQISMLQQQSSVFLPKCDNDVQNSSVKQSFANSYNSKRTMISPAQLEFFCRSGINWSNSPNELTGSSSDGDDCMSSLDINLIIVWKGVSETPSSNLHHQPIWGQSHLRINQLNYSVQIPYQCNNTNNITGFATYRREYQKHRRRRTRRRPQKVENHLNKDESNQLQYTESDLANLVRFRLDYPRHVRCSNVCDERDTVLNKLDDDDSNKNNRRHHCQNIDSSSYTYSQTFSHTNGIRSPLDLNFSCQSPSILHCEPNRLSFREQTKKFMVTISVQAEVYNSSKWPIVVQLDMNNNGDNTNKQSRCEPVSAGSPISSTANGIVLQQQQPQQQINPFRTYPSSSLHIRPLDPHDSTPYIPSLIWIGLTKLEFHLKPYETKCVTLKALAPRPGVYNVCTVTVKAAFLLPCDSHSITQVEHSHSSFITQNILPLSTFKNHNVSSLIIVE